MIVRLVKSSNNAADKKLAIGQIYTVTNEKGKRLIDEGVAELYAGSMPPAKKDKPKTDLFKPKTDK
jgi:hypothetical protein